MKKVKWVASIKRNLTVIGLLTLAFALYVGLLALFFSGPDSSSNLR